MVKLMPIDGRKKMSGHSKGHLEQPRRWNCNSVRLNERTKAVTTNRGNKPTVEFDESVAGFRSIYGRIMQGNWTERFKRPRHWNYNSVCLNK